MLTRRTVILAGRETTYGTDPALTGANGILAYDVDIDIKGEKLERAILRDSLSPMPHVIGMKDCTLTFKTELKGCGVIPSNPEIGVLLSGCGFDTGVVATTSMVFSLVSDETSMYSVAFHVYKDGNKHKILGSRGNVKFNLEAGKYGFADFSFEGLYAAVEATGLPDITGLHANKPPIVYNSSFQIAGYSPVCSKAEIDLGNTIAKRASLNASYGVQGFRITERKPTFSFDVDAVIEATNSFWSDLMGAIVDTFSMYIGSTAGNTIKLNGYFEYETLKYADKEGVSGYDIKSALVTSDANDQNTELVVTFS